MSCNCCASQIEAYKAEAKSLLDLFVETEVKMLVMMEKAHAWNQQEKFVRNIVQEQGIDDIDLKVMMDEIRKKYEKLKASYTDPSKKE